MTGLFVLLAFLNLDFLKDQWNYFVRYFSNLTPNQVACLIVLAIPLVFALAIVGIKTLTDSWGDNSYPNYP